MSISQDFTLNLFRSLHVDGTNIRSAVRIMEATLPDAERIIDIGQSTATGAIADRILNLATQNFYRADAMYSAEKEALDLLAQRIQDTNLLIMFSHLDISKDQRPQLGHDLEKNTIMIRTWMAENPDILNQITTLNLNNSDLTILPPEIELLTNLQSLDLYNTQIASLPENLTLPNLDLLELDNTKITSLPDNLNLPKLVELSLSNTPIASLPKRFNLPKLEVLALDGTQITSLPDNLTLPNLQWLDLSDTQISSLPENLNLPDLRWLYLPNTPLQKIGIASISDWKTAQNSNLLKMFSRLVMQIPQDQRPNLSGSLATDAMTIRAWMKDHSDLLDQIIELNLNSLDLTILPPEIELLENLRTLRLYGNPIVFLPDHLTLPNLRMLDLTNTKIDSLPKHLNLPSLESLYLTHTPIFALPETFNLPKLVILDLDNTKITGLPNNLGDTLFNLRGLYLRNTPIASLPKELFLAWLRVLDLKNTKISSLSHEYIEINFPNLWVLDTDNFLKLSQ